MGRGSNPKTDYGRSLTSDSTKTPVNAFVNTSLDYCNSLLYGVGEGLMDWLQRVQNAAARLDRI